MKTAWLVMRHKPNVPSRLYGPPCLNGLNWVRQMNRSRLLPALIGLGVALSVLGLACGFGAGAYRQYAWVHGAGDCTRDGAVRKGPPNGVAAPTALSSPGLAIHREGEEFVSSNTELGLHVTYWNAGFEMQVANQGRDFTSSFILKEISRGMGGLRPGTHGVETVNGDRLVVDHGTFKMTYANTVGGMRHDIVVLKRPRGEDSLEARFALGGNLVAVQRSKDEVVFHSWDEQALCLVPQIRYSGLKAWDARGQVLPSSMEVRDGCLVLAVQDKHAQYPVTIDPLSSTANLEITGTFSGQSFGYSAATAGDVNGDGYSDIIVGSPYWDLPFTDCGRVQVFLGSSTGISATPSWTYQGTGANARLGFSVSSAGDVNGDGISDVVAGAPGMAGHGVAYVFLGSLAGVGATPTATLNGNAQANSEFGWSVALAGDVNGDGYSDVLVGAPKYFNTLSAQGRAYCYYGNALTLGWTATGVPSNGQLGYCVAGIGDMDGDGAGEVAIGAPMQPKIPTTNNGAVHLFRGNMGTGLGVTASRVLTGPGSSNFGWSVAGAGDMNGDGWADLVVGAPGTTSGNGAAHLFLSDGTPTLVPLSATSSLGGTATEGMGRAVGSAGDVNGDGFADIIIGSPNYSSNTGRARVYRGSSAPLLDAAHLYKTFTGGVPSAKYGAAVCTAGDVNGDGISDVLIAAPDQPSSGSVRIFHGSPDLPSSMAAWSVQGAANYENMGTCVASAGDVNADGYSDLLVGIPGNSTMQGKVQLYLGSSSGLSATPTWTKVGENVDDGFGFCVASAGDVNGDGYSDVLVGAPRWPSGGTGAWRGKVYLFMGSSGGLGPSAAWTKDGPQTESRFGYSLSSAGDVNGDGFSDVLIGAYTQTNGAGTGEGGAYVFHGSGSGLPATANWSAVSEQHAPSNTSAFGVSVSLAGDVNGDGYDDVIIGDNYYEHVADGGANRGGAFVYHGSPTGLSASPNWAAYGANYGDEFGNNVSYAGDVNGDGYSDVIIGAYFKGATEQGGAYLFQGSAFSGLGLVPAWSVDGILDGDHLGESVCSAGDVNGDGYGDVMVGGSLKDWLYVDGGGVDVYLGGASGLTASSAWSVIGSSTGSKIGRSVALAGDVNGDGYSDLAYGVVKMTGSVYAGAGGALLHLGNEGRSQTMRTMQYRSDLSTPVRTSNGTFQVDCQWGIGQFARSSMGRTLVKLAWHVAGHGPAVPTNFFDNNSTVLSGEQASWQDSGLPGIELTQVLASMPGATSHPAWRARIRFHPATAMDGRVFGRWFRQGIHDLQVPSIKTQLAGCGPLPVTLMGLSVYCANGSAIVEWTTASEQDCADFIVERSEDAVSWNTIGQVACGGNSSQMRRYGFEDPAQLRDAVSYYRIKQVDINGTTEIFPAMAYRPCERVGTLAVWPNPFGGELHFRLPAGLRDSIVLTAVVRDMAGRELMRERVEVDGGAVATWKGCNRLPQGPCSVELVSPAGSIGHALVVHM